MGARRGRAAATCSWSPTTTRAPRTPPPSAPRCSPARRTRPPTGAPRCARSATAAPRIADGRRAGPARATPLLVAGKGHETGQEIAGAVHALRRPRGAARGPDRLAARRLGSTGDRADAGRGRRRGRRRAGRGPADAAVTGSVTARLARRGRRRPVRRRAPASGSTAHDFLAAAAAAGAVGALTHPARTTRCRASSSTTRSRRWAGWPRRCTPGSPPAACAPLGITGSSGKTSTKDLLGQVLAAAGPTVSPPGSYNNDIGLPLTVLAADEDTRFLVLEMGARGSGPHRPAVRAWPGRRSASCSTSARPTSASSAAPTAIAAGQGRAGRGAARPTAPPSSTPTTRGCSAWPRAPARRVVTTGRGRGRRRPGHRTSSLDDAARARFTLVAGGEQHPVRAAGRRRAPGGQRAVGRRRRPGRGHDARPRSPRRCRRPRRAAAGGWRWPAAPTASPSSTTPTTPTPSRCAPRWPRWPGCPATRRIAVLGAMGELGPGRRRGARAAGPRRGGRRGRPDRGRRPRCGRHSRRRGRRRASRRGGVGARAGPGRCPRAARRSCCAPGDVVLVKASRSYGLELLAADLLDGTGSDRVKSVLIAAGVGLIISILLTPAGHPRLPPARASARRSATTVPRATCPSRARPRWAARSSSAATVVRLPRRPPVPARPGTDAGFTASGLLLLFLMVGMGTVGFLDDYLKIRHRRSLGLNKTAKLVGQLVVGVDLRDPGASTSRATGMTPASTVRLLRPRHRAAGARLGRLRDPRLPVHRRVLQRGQPHRRPRRAGRRLLGDGVRLLRRSSRSGSSPTTAPASRSTGCYDGARPARHHADRRRRRWAPASASCGGTPARPGSSWATPARWPWAACSPGWRSSPAPSCCSSSSAGCSSRSRCRWSSRWRSSGRPDGGCSAWRRCTTTSSWPAGPRTPSSCGSGWSPAMAVAFGLGLFYADWLKFAGL